jgi:hypothetical protein
MDLVSVNLCGGDSGKNFVGSSCRLVPRTISGPGRLLRGWLFACKVLGLPPVDTEGKNEWKWLELVTGLPGDGHAVFKKSGSDFGQDSGKVVGRMSSKKRAKHNGSGGPLAGYKTSLALQILMLGSLFTLVESRCPDAVFFAKHLCVRCRSLQDIVDFTIRNRMIGDDEKNLREGEGMNSFVRNSVMINENFLSKALVFVALDQFGQDHNGNEQVAKVCRSVNFHRVGVAEKIFRRDWLGRKYVHAWSAKWIGRKCHMTHLEDGGHLHSVECQHEKQELDKQQIKHWRFSNESSIIVLHDPLYRPAMLRSDGSLAPWYSNITAEFEAYYNGGSDDEGCQARLEI